MLSEAMIFPVLILPSDQDRPCSTLSNIARCSFSPQMRPELVIRVHDHIYDLMFQRHPLALSQKITIPEPFLTVASALFASLLTATRSFRVCYCARVCTPQLFGLLRCSTAF